jgi:hypothetical protein
MYEAFAQMSPLQTGVRRNAFQGDDDKHMWKQAPQIQYPFSYTLGVLRVIETMFGCLRGNKSSVACRKCTWSERIMLSTTAYSLQHLSLQLSHTTWRVASVVLLSTPTIAP